MLRRKQFDHREHFRPAIGAQAMLRNAAGAVCEALESRQLLTAFTFNVPQNDGYEAVYLRPGQEQGWVRVHKNAADGTVVHEFKGDFDPGTGTFLGTGIYIVDAGGLSDFRFVDQVPAARKPTATSGAPSDHGILVQATGSPSTPGHLKIEAGLTDQFMTVTQSTSTSNTVEVLDVTVSPFRTGTSRAGSGVNKLTLRPSDVVPGSPPAPATAYSDFLATSGGGTDVIVPFLADDVFLTVDTGAARYSGIWLGTDAGFTDSFLYEEAQVMTGAGRCQVTVRGQDGQPQTRARIDFGPRGAAGTHTGHNKLHVDLNGVATLAELAGASHTVVLEEAFLDGFSNVKPATLYVEDRSTIDDLDEFDNGLAFVQPTADGTQVPLWNVSANSSASIEGDSTIGTFTVDGVATFVDTSNPSTVNKFDVGGDFGTANGVVKVMTGAAVTILAATSTGSPSSRIANLEFPVVFPATTNTGKLTLQPKSSTPSSSVPRVLVLRTLSMGSTVGKLDLTDGAMMVDYSSSTPHDYLKSAITSGYAGGAWTGYGILSSTAANSLIGDGAGYAERTEVTTAFDTTFFGQTLDDTMVLVRYTYYGDVNLSGHVNLYDFNQLAANFGATSANWRQGDSSYDGTVNLQDFNRQAANFGLSSFGPGEDESEGFGGGEEYTYEDLLAILMQMYPQYF
jgi:hypothetical protein